MHESRIRPCLANRKCLFSSLFSRSVLVSLSQHQSHTSRRGETRVMFLAVFAISYYSTLFSNPFFFSRYVPPGSVYNLAAGVSPAYCTSSWLRGRAHSTSLCARTLSPQFSLHFHAYPLEPRHASADKDDGAKKRHRRFRGWNGASSRNLILGVARSAGT